MLANYLIGLRTLSVIAVGFVTGMVFWMRRTARHLSADLRGTVGAALAMSGAALALTAFLAVGREGLETSLAYVVPVTVMFLRPARRAVTPEATTTTRATQPATR